MKKAAEVPVLKII